MTQTFAKPLPIRNPLLLPSLKRQAGAHRRSAGGQRQRLNHALRLALQHERHPCT